MLEAYLQTVVTADPALEEPAATRERLKGRFPPGAARRMTQLGMLVGDLLQQLEPTGEETLIYASAFGESRALEDYLASFPDPSPTLFQTSIHPSGVQQSLIGRKCAVRELFPLSGGATLPWQALKVALTSPSRRVLWVGGEERGTWLTDVGCASDRGFAFGVALTREPAAGAVAKIQVYPETGSATLGLPAWFGLLHERRAWSGPVGAGWRLSLTWL